MKLNPDKCVLILSDKDVKTTNGRSFTIKSSASEELLGVNNNNKINLQSRLGNPWSKTSRKLHDPGIFLRTNYALSVDFKM